MTSFDSNQNHRSASAVLTIVAVILSIIFLSSEFPSQTPAALQQPHVANSNPSQSPNYDRCWEFVTAPDQRATVCLLRQGIAPNGAMLSSQIEIGLKNGRKILITPGGPVREWHFCRHGREIAVSFTIAGDKVSDALYQTSTGKLIDKVDQEPRDLGTLPKWAKNQTELDDESVRESASLDEQRSKWLFNVMRRIETIHPGMQRKDLDALFIADGGVSTRTEERYVYRNCRVIKVDVRFKAPTEARKGIWEDPDDVIESISQPYLEPMFND